MYHQHFGMHTDPFPLSPKLVFVFHSRAFGETMAHLVYGIEQAEDIILITGGIGTGKTLAVHNLLSQVSRLFEPVLVNVTNLEYRDLLKYILLELKEDVGGDIDVPELLQHLKRALRQKRTEARKVLLIVDEAQNLSAQTLESLRLLTNLSTPEEQCLQLILVGQPGLETTIGRRELAQLNQRIRVRYRLEALSRAELAAYVEHRLKVAGCQRNVFKPAALERIYVLSEGIPRVVNILASRALLAAFVDGQAQVDARHVRAEDLPPVTDEHPHEPARLAQTPSTAPSTPLPAPAAPAPAPPPAAPLSAAVPPSPAPTPPPERAAPPPAAAARPDRPGPRRGALVAAAILAVAVLVVIWARPGGDAPAVPDAVELAQPQAEAGPTEAPVVSTGPAAPAPQQALHVASYRDVSRADRLVARLSAAGLGAYRREGLLGGEPWIRVYVGPLADQDEAVEVRSRLIAAGTIAYCRVVPYEG